ncbi:hypothetical protein JKF63_01162 [Porcisia hertigi]|uniref:Uncharacterized protein n=1 Tax=Porcisia hertigi TaxID=2761500 RepID=A0A836IDW6_9TRYP|nr:hypothetical protein JKF63_01162 [Porcisia hertigi]
MAAQILHAVAAIAAGVLLLATLRVNGLKVAFISSGVPSDLLQIASIVRAAHQRNHSATVLVDTLELSGCEEVFGDSVCTPVTCSPGGCHHKKANFSTALRIALHKRKFFPDVVLSSAFILEADQACEQLGVPLLILSGRAHDVLSIRTTSPPFLPFALGRRYPILETVVSAFQGLSASLWDLTSSGMAQSPQMTRHVITQGILGFDITGPMCPNVHPIGFFRGDGEVFAKGAFSGIDPYIEGCGGRFIYASLPPESSAHRQQFHSALRAVSNETNACVLWHTPLTEAPLRYRRFPEDQRVKVTDDGYAAPTYVLHRYKPILVISHKVNEILYDSVLAESPIVYVGGNRVSCSQLSSTGILACTSSLLTSDILSAVRSVYNVSSVRERVRVARRMSFLMGGAQKTVEVAELVAALGSDNMDFVCDRNILLSPFGYDGSVALCMTFFVGLVFILSFHCCQISLKWYGVR